MPAASPPTRFFLGSGRNDCSAIGDKTSLSGEDISIEVETIVPDGAVASLVLGVSDPTSEVPDSYFRDSSDPLQINYFMKIYTMYDIDSTNQTFKTRLLLSNRHVLTRDQYRVYLRHKKRGEGWTYDHQWMWPCECS